MLVDVSVVIVTWNTRELVRRCVRSVLERSGGVSLEATVVDNASTDGTCDTLCREFPDVRLIANETNVGFPSAANRGIVDARGRYVLLLNSDTEATPGALSEMVRFMDAHRDVAALGPRLVDRDGALQPSCYSNMNAWKTFAVAYGLADVMPYAQLERLSPRNVLRRIVDFPDHERVLYPNWFRGACMLLRGDAVRDVDGLDERFFVYFEEIDLFDRLREAGWTIAYLPTATFIHHGDVVIRMENPRLTLAFWESRRRLCDKRGRSFRTHRAALLVGTLMRLFNSLTVASFGSPSARQRFLTCTTILKWLLDDGEA